jgi:hypothetical protein
MQNNDRYKSSFSRIGTFLSALFNEEERKIQELNLLVFFELLRNRLRVSRKYEWRNGFFLSLSANVCGNS